MKNNKMYSLYKSILTYLIITLFVFLWVSVVFWSNLVFESKILSVDKLSNNIFLWSQNLKNNIVVFKSNLDLSNYSLTNSCNINSKFLWKKLNEYFFLVNYNLSCKDSFVYLLDWEKIISWSKIKFNLFTKSKIFELFSDLSDKDLLTIKEKLEKIDKMKQKYKWSWFLKLKNDRFIEENKYKLSILNEILNLRKEKYLTPISWVTLPTRYSKIPNSPRPYRSSYTDWIHHWWDFDTNFWHDVRAIDSWVIVRIVSDFKFNDLNKIKKGKNLTYIDKLNNLDILRWNQIWLKTAKWDVVFYSHLSYISPDLKVWKMVTKGEIIWKVGISGVPDKNYKDYHMHLPIQKNPHIFSKAWKYNLIDYEKWDWYFKGKTYDYILKNQSKVFYE